MTTDTEVTFATVPSSTVAAWRLIMPHSIMNPTQDDLEEAHAPKAAQDRLEAALEHGFGREEMLTTRGQSLTGFWARVPGFRWLDHILLIDDPILIGWRGQEAFSIYYWRTLELADAQLHRRLLLWAFASNVLAVLAAPIWVVLIAMFGSVATPTILAEATIVVGGMLAMVLSHWVSALRPTNRGTKLTDLGTAT